MSAGLKVNRPLAKQQSHSDDANKKELIMKTFIRVALTILSLSGVAYAQSAKDTGSAATSGVRHAPPQQGNDYNFLVGGGG